MNKWGLICLSCFITICVSAQRITPEQYIEQYKDIAISEMKRMGVPAAITLAQGLLETENGNSELVLKSNNHFGIKCKSTWKGASVTHDDDLTGECFRAYETAEESFRDHSNFLRGNTRYGSLFNLEPMDYSGWAYGLKRAGYATNPGYPSILIKNIIKYNLQQYSVKAMSESPGFEASKYSHDSLVITKMDSVLNIKKDSTVESTPDVQYKVIGINKCKCVFAKKGVPLFAIATANNININKLLQYNEMAVEGILEKDQIIFLQKKSKIGESGLYKVHSGETLYDIAQKNGIQLQYLLNYNRLNNNDVPRSGSVLFLKPAIAKQPLAKKESVKKQVIHIVARKEGLNAIAQKYNVTVKQLKKWNKLSSNELKVGQKIKIPK